MTDAVRVDFMGLVPAYARVGIKICFRILPGTARANEAPGKKQWMIACGKAVRQVMHAVWQTVPCMAAYFFPMSGSFFF